MDRPGADRAYWRGGGCACHTRGRSTVWRTARPSYGVAGTPGWTAPLHGDLSVLSRVGGPCGRDAAERSALARRPPGSGAALLLGHDMAAGRTHRLWQVLLPGDRQGCCAWVQRRPDCRREGDEDEWKPVVPARLSGCVRGDLGPRRGTAYSGDAHSPMELPHGTPLFHHECSTAAGAGFCRFCSLAGGAGDLCRTIRHRHGRYPRRGCRYRFRRAAGGTMRYALCCVRCGRDYDDDGRRLRCECGGMLDLRFEPSFRPEMTAGRPYDQWRYREALPVGDDVVTMGEGWTPLLPVAFDGRALLIKQEQLFPTGSFKDRGAAVLMTRLRELGVKRVVEDSSGNAGCAVAAYAAHAGIACDIYVPMDTSPAKTAQIEAYGATLHRVPGTREDTARAALEAAVTCVYASHVYSPWFLHGTKTFAYEVAERLGWPVPDTLVLPAGTGHLLLGAYLGFTELARAGIVSHVPVSYK